ncbi:MAG: hypothetical protein KKB90_11550 [Actinobacteria bacterium]|nr:hypothetical protein [Actinomycetota bacterium]MCG2818256.1 hypothetical protein [Actinomycetes bacterium]MBU4219580.1 hypothetical protein [Actinomycetota bacterium]MBU4358793.1 hypothetical protein [Actinomycetota bacterium]MBU4391434.1 hypothetical protein [Actinomycetota bacterium]
MKKRLIIASAVAGVLLIAFMGVGGFAQTASPTVTATYSPTLNFTMTPTAIDFGAIVPTDPVTTATMTSAVAIKSNTLWNFTLTTTPILTGSGTAAGRTIGDTQFTFLQNNPSAGVTFDVATGGFQANMGVLLAHGDRGVKSWDFNFQLSKDFNIWAGPYAFPVLTPTQVYTVTAI